mmetsp:Transcript_20359/g.52849  ORF Transcript_20359/g.52849 Transcript_20359/m.52849 type:complete len:359 (+) Transcript_20359:23-1099(+)
MKMACRGSPNIQAPRLLFLSALATFVLAGTQGRPHGTFARSRTTRHTISGLSAGGSMVAQHMVAFSSLVDGAAINAGSPYGCGSLPDFDNTCNYDDPPINVETLFRTTADREATGAIDAVKNLADMPVYLYAGTQDSVTYFGVMEAARRYFAHYVNDDSMKVVFNVPSEHGYITDGYGECCDCIYGTYVLNCRYDQAGDILQHIYRGELKYPTAWSAPGRNKFEVEQRSYTPEGSWWPGVQMRETGWAYVPEKCHANVSNCRLHVHYHGCGEYGLMPANQIGYNQWAEANNIVVLYPMARSAIGNLMGCWDWWGATGRTYDTKAGVQLNTVLNIIDNLQAAIKWDSSAASNTVATMQK